MSRFLGLAVALGVMLVAMSPAQPQPAAVPVVVTVHPAGTWIDSGVDVRKGDGLTIIVSRTVVSRPPATINPSRFSKPSAVIFKPNIAVILPPTMIGRIDDVTFPIGSHYRESAPATGRLFLMITGAGDASLSMQAIISDISIATPTPSTPPPTQSPPTQPPTQTPSTQPPTQTPTEPPPTPSPTSTEQPVTAPPTLPPTLPPTPPPTLPPTLPPSPTCGSSLTAPCLGVPGWIWAVLVIAIVSAALRFWPRPKLPAYAVTTELKDGAANFPGGIPTRLEMTVKPGATVFRGSVPIVKREVQHD